MRRTVLPIALLLAGCFDFSRFDHLPDGAVLPRDLGPTGMDGAILAADVLINEPFDQLDQTRWDNGDAPVAAFTIDETTFVEGMGALSIDVTQLDPNEANTGALFWSGSALPSDVGTRRLRFYARYRGEVDNGVNLAVLSPADGNTGEAVVLSPVSMSDPSQGASVANEQYPQLFESSGTIVHSGEWHCYELSVEQIGNQAVWQSTLRIDEVPQPAASLTTKLTQQITTLNIGFSLVKIPQNGAKQAWIDAVVMTRSDAIIGCPYSLK